MHYIDLRSDTVTKPTPGMLEAMMKAEVGDDVFRQDPSVNELQEKGLTYIYNDAISGKSSFRDPSKKWVLIEFNCVHKDSPHPHPGGYNVLFADGHVQTTKRLPSKITKLRQAN